LRFCRGICAGRLSRGLALAYWRILAEFRAKLWWVHFSSSAEPWGIAWVLKEAIFGG